MDIDITEKILQFSSQLLTVYKDSQISWTLSPNISQSLLIFSKPWKWESLMSSSPYTL